MRHIKWSMRKINRKIQREKKIKENKWSFKLFKLYWFYLNYDLDIGFEKI
jgi:hypothetical protein